jgi:hypothetical protein
MFYLVWKTFTRLAKEIAIASIYGSSLDRPSKDDERRFQTTWQSRPQEPAATLNAEGVARLRAAFNPTDLP